MKTKKILLLACLLLSLTAIANDTVLVINGVKWATRNVNTPGTFVSTAETYGYFYQWNSKIGWPSTGNIGSISATDGSTTWNSSWENDDSIPVTWATTNDPSPAGWRVPTEIELESLTDTSKVRRSWTTQNGVLGEKFIDKTNGNSIFLPTSGSRSSSDGSLGDVDTTGCYWSATSDVKGYGTAMLYESSYCDLCDNFRGMAFSIRPVLASTSSIKTAQATNISVYPNLVKESFTVKGINGTASLSLVDINGHVVITKNVSDGQSINISSLSQGIYIVQINTLDGILQKKLIKE